MRGFFSHALSLLWYRVVVSVILLLLYIHFTSRAFSGAFSYLPFQSVVQSRFIRFGWWLGS